jgi:hypothetical protein
MFIMAAHHSNGQILFFRGVQTLCLKVDICVLRRSIIIQKRSPQLPENTGITLKAYPLFGKSSCKNDHPPHHTLDAADLIKEV